MANLPPSHEDDLSDVVPSAKFWREFPDGNIPIAHTEHLIWRDPDNPDVLQALKDTLWAYDQTRTLLKNMSASEVMAVIDNYMLAPYKERAYKAECLHSLAREGLSIRTIVRLIPDTWDAQKRAISVMCSQGKSTLLSDAQAEMIMTADEMMIAGDTRDEIKRVTGIRENTLRSIDRFRTCSDVGYEGAMKWAFTQLMNDKRPIDVCREMQVKFPKEAANISFHTVYSLTRPHRIERNKKRFGWNEEDAA